MLEQVTPISKQKFYEKFNVKELDLAANGLFTQDDISFINGFSKPSSTLTKFKKLYRYIPAIVRNPSLISSLFFSRRTSKMVQDYPIVRNNSVKASIAKAFKPKKILEIGTYIGCGAAAFKTASPRSTVYSMNPKEDTDSNNPISMTHVGIFYKRKGIDIVQLWADSTKFDYLRLGAVDVSYIDGNHSYQFVFHDLINTSFITGKAIIIDDYAPRRLHNRYNSSYFPWNESVTAAVDKFVRDFGYLFKYAYYIEDTPYCILIK